MIGNMNTCAVNFFWSIIKTMIGLKVSGKMLLIGAFLLSALVIAQSQTADTLSSKSLLDIMAKTEVVDMTITTRLDSLFANQRTDRSTAGFISFKHKKTGTLNFSLEMQSRGRFRRANCDFPPLKINLSKKELKAAGLKNYDEFKLVTHCKDNELGRTLVLKEYLIYTLYNELTPLSYRVQLARVTFRDSLEKGKRISTWGFLIEDDKEFTDRTGLKEKNLMGLQPENLIPQYEKMNAIFQFMIGNTDWSLAMLRNVKIMQQEDGGLMPIPYDFDFSVLVRAPYMRPNQDIGQSIKMERIYMGAKYSGQEMLPLSIYIRNKKKVLVDKILDFNRLSPEIQQEMVQYLEEFFSMIESKEALENVYFPQK
jgi:hypothetical protein